MVILGHGIFFSQKVSNLCVFRPMDCPINHLCKIIYLELHRISKIRPFISVEAANSSLTLGLLTINQNQNNAVARLVLKQSRQVHIRPLLRSLHWLPVKDKIEYKIATFCHQCLNCNTTPSFLSEPINPCVPARSLRSHDASLLSVPRMFVTKYGERPFSHFGPNT